MPYSPGELRERVTIRRTTQTQDAYGTLTETTSDLGPYWALVRPMSVRERNAAQQMEASADYLFVFRYSVHQVHSITTADTLVWRGTEFNIRGIKDRGPQAMFIEIEAERGVAI